MTPEELAAIRERDAMTVLPFPLTVSERDRRLLLAEVDRLKESITVTDRGLHIIVEEQHRDVADLRAEVDRLTGKLADVFDEGAAAMRAELRDTDGSGWPYNLYRESKMSTSETEICGAENPDYPGEYTCEYPRGHAPVPLEGNLYKHAAPHSGAWWNTPLPTPEPSQVYEFTSALGARVMLRPPEEHFDQAGALLIFRVDAPNDRREAMVYLDPENLVSLAEIIENWQRGDWKRIHVTEKTEPQGDPVYGRESRPIAPWETQ